MKGMLSITFLSVVTAVIFMSGGYGHWEKDVTVEGTITVVVPEPESDSGDNDVPVNSQNVGTEGDTNDTATSSFDDDTSTTDTNNIEPNNTN